MKNLSTREPVQLVVLNTWRNESDVIGFYAVINRLDEVTRLPGESLQQMTRRALHAVRGAGQLLVFPRIRS